MHNSRDSKGKFRQRDRWDELENIGACVMLVCLIFGAPYIIGIVQALSEVAR